MADWFLSFAAFVQAISQKVQSCDAKADASSSGSYKTNAVRQILLREGM